MSFLPINQDDEQGATQQTTNNPAGEAPPQTGGSVGEEAGGSAAKASAVGTPTQFGSSASKLGDYLTANAPQVTQRADAMAGNLNQQFGSLQSGITNAGSQFGQQVQGGYAANNPDTVNQAMANPSQFAATPSNVQAFQGQYNNAYTGPQSFVGTQPYADIQGQINSAVQQGSLLQNQAGLQSYLQGKGGPNATKASTTLDSLLFRGNPEASQKVATAGKQFESLPGQLSDVTTGANQSVQDAQKSAQDSQAYARQALTGSGATLGANLTNQFNTNQKNYTDQNAARSSLYDLMNTSTGGSLTPQQAASVGIQPGQFEDVQALNNVGMGINFPNFTPVNPGNYYQQGKQGAPPTMGSSATPEQLAQMQALTQLSGGGYQQPFDPAQAGSQFALGPNGSFDYTAAMGEGRQNLQRAYDTNYANPAVQNDPLLMSKLQTVYAYLNGGGTQPGQNTPVPQTPTLGGGVPGGGSITPPPPPPVQPILPGQPIPPPYIPPPPLPPPVGGSPVAPGAPPGQPPGRAYR